MRASVALVLLLVCAGVCVDGEAKRKEKLDKADKYDKPDKEKKGTLSSPNSKQTHEGKSAGSLQHGKGSHEHVAKERHPAVPVTPSTSPATPSSPPRAGTAVTVAHALAVLILLCALLTTLFTDGEVLGRGVPTHRRALLMLTSMMAFEAALHFFVPVPWLTVSLVIVVSVLFTINPVMAPTDSGCMPSLNMGTVPFAAVVWLGAVGVLSWADFVRALYGSDTLRPYHLVVMFLGSVYLCTALERSGFLHTAAVKVVTRYGRSPWGLFWALGCFSATLTVLIPDDIVTMTLTPITIRMCQLLSLPEIPFLFSQFFAGNIWAVTLVTGNPTNVLLAEDMGDTFMTFAARMGMPGVAAGLTSFALMYWTNRSKVDVPARDVSSDKELGRLQDAAEGEAETEGGAQQEVKPLSPRGKGEGDDRQEYTYHGIFCLARVLAATAFCALEAFHGLPVYLVVLIMGLASLLLDAFLDRNNALDVLRHMPWELFSFVTGFLVLAEAMSTCGISFWLASVFMPLAASRDVAYVSGFVTMIFCNVFETLPATLIVFKMIDSVPQWSPQAIAAAGSLAPLYKDARRAALSAVIFGSNFGANTACIGSLGGLMMRRLAALQGVTVTNSMLLKQGIPVMIPTMFVACFCLIHQKEV